MSEIEKQLKKDNLSESERRALEIAKSLGLKRML